MEGYTSEKLNSIFRKNMLLSGRKFAAALKENNRLAYGLLFWGAVFFILMMLIDRTWNTEALWHDLFFYLLDIATTVLFWEAAGLMLVENREMRSKVRSYLERFSSIDFNNEEQS